MAAPTTIEGFYREHAQAVYAFLVSLCRDRSRAEDLMHDTFTKATLALGSYRGGNPRSWLFSIARNVFLDDVRRSRPAAAVEFDHLTAPSDPDVVERDAIDRALGQMPERMRTALLLVDGAGVTTAELAESLGLTPGTARVLVHRARLMFRTHYEKDSR